MVKNHILLLSLNFACFLAAGHSGRDLIVISNGGCTDLLISNFYFDFVLTEAVFSANHYMYVSISELVSDDVFLSKPYRDDKKCCFSHFVLPDRFDARGFSASTRVYSICFIS